MWKENRKNTRGNSINRQLIAFSDKLMCFKKKNISKMQFGTGQKMVSLNNKLVL